MPPTPERRSEPRVASLNLVSVDQCDDADGLLNFSFTVGRTLDLSHRGMRLELSQPLPLKARVSLNLVLVNRIIQLQGLICSVSPTAEGGHAMGIRFIDLSAENHNALHEYLQLCAQQPPPDD